MQNAEDSVPLPVRRRQRRAATSTLRRSIFWATNCRNAPVGRFYGIKPLLNLFGLDVQLEKGLHKTLMGSKMAKAMHGVSAYALALRRP